MSMLHIVDNQINDRGWLGVGESCTFTDGWVEICVCRTYNVCQICRQKLHIWLILGVLRATRVGFSCIVDISVTIHKFKIALQVLLNVSINLVKPISEEFSVRSLRLPDTNIFKWAVEYLAELGIISQDNGPPLRRSHVEIQDLIQWVRLVDDFCKCLGS